ncbi:peptidylprolyl isomerase [Endobacter medicaginis]|uniref:Peptidyl-prolyl cis-trans isomerase n=1 Tax=Endobacter medicaginis TaxID=1181271 RepID=A0A839V0L4_9PROT|nr:FKBP-type peptidyl-prolyl cis-trans isomerase [Endobacter medicaginis]MBB3174094.1 peptidylprolyl isomerase [Endobacter medicaginis]MCX5474138.1 FKBP-type peptidyl-prolyl cis-trans isomerase [Endobacter medicaginis]NVN31197.1 FKBP-type peptidyl-prolyl cis-trans isomerase [Endobacter medicaginis]
MRRSAFAALSALLLCATGAAQASDVIDDSFVRTATGIRFHDDVRGSGPEPVKGQTVEVLYTGWLMTPQHTKGKMFDHSTDPAKPFSFTLGADQVIRGWEMGVSTMHVGGERTLVIPPDLGYGPQGAGPIPGGATLIFDIKLLAIH